MEGTMNAVHCVGREEPWQYVEDAPIPQIKDDEVLLEIKLAAFAAPITLCIAVRKLSSILMTSISRQFSVTILRRHR